MIPLEPQPTDGELVRRVRDGESAAFDLLVRRYLRRAMAVAWDYLEHLQDAEDAVQDAFRRTLQALDRFDPERPFRPWFFTIVRNAALNARERRGRWPSTAVPDNLPAPAATPLERASATQLRERLDRALAGIPEMQRRCFRLCVLEELTSREAGEALGIKEETVRTHVFRARKALTAIMNRERSEGWTA